MKEVRRREWGDVVPLRRCFAYGEEVMNMAYGGDKRHGQHANLPEERTKRRSHPECDHRAH